MAQVVDRHVDEREDGAGGDAGNGACGGDVVRLTDVQKPHRERETEHELAEGLDDLRDGGGVSLDFGFFFRLGGCLCSVFPAGGFLALSEAELLSREGEASASCSLRLSLIFRSSSLTEGFSLVIVAPSADFFGCSKIGSD